MRVDFMPDAFLRVSTENIHYQVIDSRHAVEVGRYTMLYLLANSEKEMEIKGRMLIHWEKSKTGVWKIKVDMWH